jgi:hypothetical protein
MLRRLLVDRQNTNLVLGNEKIVCGLIIVFTHWIGATIYYFVRRGSRLNGRLNICRLSWYPKEGL